MPFSTMIPLRTRDSFFRDKYFSDCWDALGHFDEDRSSLGSSRFSDDDFELRLRPLYRRRKFFPTSSFRSEFEDSKNLGASSSLAGLGIQTDETQFKVSIDVQQFKPEELVVKTVDNSTILIEGKHEEKEDSHGFISRNFSRKITLPSDVKVEEIKSTFTLEGLLIITAPRHKSVSTNANASSATASSTTASSGTTSSATETSSAQPQSLSQRIEEERKRAEAEFEKSTSDILGRRDERESLGHRIFQAFPEFDPLPFWKRGKASSLLEDLKAERKSASSLSDELRSTKQSSSVLDESSSLNSTSGGVSDSGKAAAAEIQSDSENFMVMLDVQQFKPEEVTIKTFDSFIEIEGKHEAKSDSYGHMSRQFKRKYILPQDVRAEDIQCHFSAEGILVVTAPRVVKQIDGSSSASKETNAHLVQIQRDQQQGKEILHKIGTQQEEKSRVGQQIASASTASAASASTASAAAASASAASASLNSSSGSKLEHERVIPIESNVSAANGAGSHETRTKNGPEEQGQRVTAASECTRPRTRAKTPEFPMMPPREVIPIEEHSGYGSFIRRVDENEFRPRNVSGTEAKSVSTPAPPSPAPELAKGERLIRISIAP